MLAWNAVGRGRLMEGLINWEHISYFSATLSANAATLQIAKIKSSTTFKKIPNPSFFCLVCFNKFLESDLNQFFLTPTPHFPSPVAFPNQASTSREKQTKKWLQLHRPILVLPLRL